MPRAPKKCGRQGCEQRTTSKYCPEHTAETQWRRGPTDRTGSTRQSRREREIVLAREPACYLRYEGCTGTPTEDDHVIPVSQGGTDALDNRRGACHHCHRIKSLHEAARSRSHG